MSQKMETYPVASHFVDFGIDADFNEDPYTPLLKLAEEHEVIGGRGGVFNGVRVPNNFLFDDHEKDVFITLSFDAWRKVTTDHKRFSSQEAYGRTLGKVFGPTLMSMDQPEHTLYKKMILPSFSHRIVTTELVTMAKPIIDETLSSIVADGKGELVSQFTSIFPYLIVAKMFGVPPEYGEEAERLVVASLRMGQDPAAAFAAFEGMNSLYQKVVDHHRETDLDDLTTMLMETEIDGKKLTDSEIVAFIKQIVAAGLDTTVRQTANLIYLLLENPDQYQDLMAHRDLLESAIWESLRVISAGGNVPRVATEDVDVAGVTIPKGSGVYAIQHVANMDRSKWENPRKFDIRRKRQPIATFGAGIHTCLGQSLSIAEMMIAMNGVLDRLPNLRKDPDHWEHVKIQGFQLRSPTILPVLWDA